MARAFWGRTDAVGGRLRSQGGDPNSWFEVVGVVRHYTNNADENHVRVIGTPTTFAAWPMQSIW